MDNSMNLFLTIQEVRELTGYSSKSKQIAQLRRMGLAFFINAGGRPVVTVTAVEGRKPVPAQTAGWQPAALNRN